MSKEMGQVYLERFQDWAESMSDDDFLQMVNATTGRLNREEIKKRAGISEQAIKKNGNVKSELADLEEELRKRGVLPLLTEAAKQVEAGPKLYDKNAKRAAMDSRRVAQLEAVNHDLKVRVSDLEKQVEELQSKLGSAKETVEAINDGLSVFTLCPMN